MTEKTTDELVVAATRRGRQCQHSFDSKMVHNTMFMIAPVGQGVRTSASLYGDGHTDGDI